MDGAGAPFETGGAGGPAEGRQTGDVPTASVTLFRFATRWNRHWAWWQMLNSRWKLKRLPGATFMRQCGTGSREGFYPWPNFGVYGVLAAWPSLAHAREQVEGSRVYRRYREHAAEHVTLYLHATRSRGAWGGSAPFEVCAPADAEGPVAVLTRASIRPRSLRDFWGRTPGIRAEIPLDPREGGLAFRMGLGELPWLNQITFTLWTDREALQRFAWAPESAHGQAIAAARAGDWFSEYLFARFTVAGVHGDWSDADLSHLKQTA